MSGRRFLSIIVYSDDKVQCLWWSFDAVWPDILQANINTKNKATRWPKRHTTDPLLFNSCLRFIDLMQFFALCIKCSHLFCGGKIGNKWQNLHDARLQKQLQTALILSVTFIWFHLWVGLNGLWFQYDCIYFSFPPPPPPPRRRHLRETFLDALLIPKVTLETGVHPTFWCFLRPCK
jgi:hypothetical protein